MNTVKKSIASFLCICLALSMLLACTGCKSSGDAEKFVGEWEANVDMTDMLNNMLTSDPDTAELADYIKVDSYVLTLNFTFNNDGTYKIAIDRDALSTTTDALLATLKTGVMDYFEDMVNEMASAEGVTVEEVLDALGVADLEEFLAVSGVDMDDMFDMDTMLTAFDAVESSGKYTAKDGELRLTSDSNELDIENYEFTSDTEVKLVDQTDDGELGDIVLVKK